MRLAQHLFLFNVASVQMWVIGLHVGSDLVPKISHDENYLLDAGQGGEHIQDVAEHRFASDVNQWFRF